MLGRGGIAQQGEMLDLGGLLELVGDDQRYKAKLQELQAQVTEANRIRELAAQNNMKAEENRRAVREMLDLAKAARAETAAIKAENERAVGEIEKRRKEVEAQVAQHNQLVRDQAEAYSNGVARLEARDKACQDREVAAKAIEAQAALILAKAEADIDAKAKSTDELIKAMTAKAQQNLAEAEHAKQESLRIKDVIAKKHAKYNEFVMSLAAEK